MRRRTRLGARRTLHPMIIQGIDGVGGRRVGAFCGRVVNGEESLATSAVSQIFHRREKNW